MCRWPYFVLPAAFARATRLGLQWRHRVKTNFQESPPVEPTSNPPSEAEPLEFFLLGRRIRRGLLECSGATETGAGGDVAYLWIQLRSDDSSASFTRDHCLNIIDEAASLGVNWLVVSLGDAPARQHVPDLCRWANDTHEMVVCLHTPDGQLLPDERDLLRELPADSSFLLAEPRHGDVFADLEAAGVHVGLATPAESADHSPCEYPNRMIFVDAQGRLYTCGLVAGESDFFLGSVFDGSLDEIMHNPRLPHSVHATPAPAAHQSCSGCPPLVAKYLCGK